MVASSSLISKIMLAAHYRLSLLMQRQRQRNLPVVVWLLLLLLLLLVPPPPGSVVEAQLSSSNVTYPSIRYVQWGLVRYRYTLTVALGYEETTWNNVGTANVEKFAYESLSETQKTAVTNVLDINEETWDCYINHYTDYDWDELGDAGIQVYFILLGYGRLAWLGQADPPVTESMSWSELSTIQREAAEQICYFENIWDGNPLTTWSTTTTALPTATPLATTPTPTTVSPTKSPTQSPTEQPVTASPIAEGKTASPTTPNPTNEPTEAPTPSPTKAPVVATDSPVTTTTNPTGAPVVNNNFTDMMLLLLPEFRFTAWPDLDDRIRTEAIFLGYDEMTWNNPGTEAIERLRYRTIAATAPTLPWKDNIDEMGFTETTWDCYVNHYIDFEWSDLRAVPHNVQQHFETLGYNQAMWENSITSESDSKAWANLTSSEQEAALAICYFPPLWDGWSLDVREEWDGYLQSALGFPTPAPTTHDEISVPYFRFIRWSALSEARRSVAAKVGYSEETWNKIGKASIESYSFYSIDHVFVEPQTPHLRTLGFKAPMWDCWMNHYEDYSWSELEQIDVQKYYVAIGYTEERWKTGRINRNDYKRWNKLSSRQRWGARGVCYIRQIWDGISLEIDTEWGSDFLERSSASLWKPRSSLFLTTMMVAVGFLA